MTRKQTKLLSFALILALHSILFLSLEPSTSPLVIKPTSEIKISIKKASKSKVKSLNNRILKELSFSGGNIGKYTEGDNYIGTFGDDTGKVFGRDLTLYTYLYSYIKQHIYYPRTFKHLNVTGHIQSRLVFDKDGTLRKDRTKITGSNLYMISYFRGIFHKIFEEQVPYRLINDPAPFYFIDVTVTFGNGETDQNKNLSYRRGRDFGYVVYNHHKLFNKGIINPGELINLFEENFTDKGKAKKQFWIDQANRTL